MTDIFFVKEMKHSIMSLKSISEALCSIQKIGG